MYLWKAKKVWGLNQDPVTLVSACKEKVECLEVKVGSSLQLLLRTENGIKVYNKLSVMTLVTDS